MFDTPVLYLIFNRPNLTEITFPSICKIKPKKLFIAADGPRIGNINDEISCKIVRDYVLSKIDWDCDLKILFRENNLGCGLSVSSALDWFFSYVDEGIILEDDCLPNKSFFVFCENMLEKYRDENVVGHISGTNLIYNNSNIINNSCSYYFSAIIHIWGWATWKRSWKNYNFHLSNIYFDHNKKFYNKIFIHEEINKFWSNKFKDTKNKFIDTWDYQLQFSLWSNNQLAITPQVNLITNLGFGEQATHTKNRFDILSNLPNTDIKKIFHPRAIKINSRLDLLMFFHAYNIKFDRSLFKWKSKFISINRFFKNKIFRSFTDVS
jgi:hypothetical protein